MIAELRNVRALVRGPVRGWMVTAVLGSCFLAGLDTLGVAAMLPLMQLITGSSPNEGILGWISGVIGTTDSQRLILVIAGAIGFSFIAKSAVTAKFRWWLLGHTTSLEAEASTEMMHRYLSEPFASYRVRNLSEVYRNILSSVSQTFGGVVLGVIGLLVDILTLIAVGAVLLVLSPLVAVFAVVFFTVLGWGVQAALKSRHRKIGQVLVDADFEAWTALRPGLDAFREARLTSSADYFVEKFGKARVRRAGANRVASLISELPKYVLEVGFVAGICGIASILFATSTPEVALSTLGVFAAAATRMLPTLNRAVATVGVIRAGRIGLEILSREVNTLKQDEVKSARQAPNKTDFSGDIVIDSVSYTYKDAEEPVLRGVTTRIQQGTTTAFVGMSGAGKSTLLDVLLGLLRPTSGAIHSGGNDIFQDLPSWYATLGVVPQDVFLLDDTLANNIAFGQSPHEIDSVRLTEAVELAQLTSLLGELPEGLETRLGERGVRLSGGQRQRVGIARALYRRPAVLVLDEATSALDNATERKISETIDALSGQMTIILVAHRLSTVRRADKIVFMSSGQIETEGTFEEVEEASADFSHLVALGRLA